MTTHYVNSIHIISSLLLTERRSMLKAFIMDPENANHELFPANRQIMAPSRDTSSSGTLNVFRGRGFELLSYLLGCVIIFLTGYLMLRQPTKVCIHPVDHIIRIGKYSLVWLIITYINPFFDHIVCENGTEDAVTDVYELDFDPVEIKPSHPINITRGWNLSMPLSYNWKA